MTKCLRAKIQKKTKSHERFLLITRGKKYIIIFVGSYFKDNIFIVYDVYIYIYKTNKISIEQVYDLIYI